MGKAIVSTSLGAEGYPVANGQELMLADEPDSFAHAVLHLLDNRQRREELGRAGQALVQVNYDWGVLIPRLEQIYEGLRHSAANN